MNTNLTSSAFNLNQIYGYCIQAVWTGTPTGTFKLQASADPSDIQLRNANQQPVNWTDVANSSQAVTIAGSYMWNVTEIMYGWVRLVYTDTSSGASTAVLTVSTINTKGV